MARMESGFDAAAKGLAALRAFNCPLLEGRACSPLRAVVRRHRVVTTPASASGGHAPFTANAAKLTMILEQTPLPERFFLGFPLLSTRMICCGGLNPKSGNRSAIPKFPAGSPADRWGSGRLLPS